MYIEKIDHLYDAMYTALKSLDDMERELRNKGYSDTTKEIVEVLDKGYSIIDDIDTLTKSIKRLFSNEQDIKEHSIEILLKTNKIKDALEKSGLEETEIAFASKALINQGLNDIHNNIKGSEEYLRYDIVTINEYCGAYLSTEKAFQFADPENYREVIKVFGEECVDYSQKAEQIHQADILHHGDVNGGKLDF